MVAPRWAVKLAASIVLVATLVGPVAAKPSSPYDVAWGSLSFGLGRASKLGGDLGDRSERARCSDGSCSLSPRFALGGGFGRWGVELHIAATPFTDTGEMVHLDRSALMAGPIVRYSVFRRYGFDLSVRGGFEIGTVDGDPPIMVAPTACDPERPQTCASTLEDAPTHGLFGVSTGVSLGWRVRFDRGFFGIQADFDVTAVRVAYAERDVYGTLATTTFGIMFGSMVDAP